MAKYKKMFMDFMDKNGMKYTDKDEFVLRVGFEGKNLKSIPIYVFFNENDESLVQFKCWEIANFKGKEARGLVACNKANREYRWIKFCVDKDIDVIASIDSRLDYNSCGEECTEMVLRMVQIIDETYPLFAKALWG